MFNNLKLKSKLFVMILIPVLILIIALQTFIGYYSYNRAINVASQIGETKSAEYAYKIKGHFDKAFDAANALAISMEGMREQNVADRNTVNAIMRNILEENSDYIGIWTVWEPNAFDGKDFLYADLEGYDETGAFMSHWYRYGNEIKNNASIENYNNRYNEDWYKLSFKSGEEVILEPHMEEMVNGDKVQMTSVTVPIKDDGNVIGVVGIDITFEKLLDINSDLKLYDSGFGRIISNKGIVVAHPEPNRIGRTLNDLKDENGDEIFKKMKEGKIFSTYSYSVVFEETAFKSYVPIQIGKTSTLWYYSTVVKRNEILESSKRLIQSIIYGAILIIVMILAVIVFVSSNISNPIKVLTESIADFANYDFTKNKNKRYINRKDEIGQINKAIEKMRQNIIVLIENINNASIKVASSSQQLTATSDQVLTAADEVARTIEEIASGASSQAQDTEEGVSKAIEMGQLIENSIKHMKMLNNLAFEVEQLKEEGAQTMLDLIKEADVSSAATEEIKEVVVNVKDSALEIERASSMIEDIAEQTNLLALNAAIEAASAGEKGKGFAVVADEIRKLSIESNTITKEISSIIKELTEKAEGSVITVEKVVEITEKQKENIKTAGMKFEGIAEAIDKTKKEIEYINASTGEINTKKEELLALIENLSALAQENAAATEEASASVQQQTASMTEVTKASHTLTKLAEEMGKHIMKFKVKD